MKNGSKKMILMIGIYVVMTLVILAIFVVPGLFNKGGEKPRSDKEVHNERIIGDAGYEEERKTQKKSSVDTSVSVSVADETPADVTETKEDISFEEEEPLEEDDYQVAEEPEDEEKEEEKSEEDKTIGEDVPDIKYYMFTVKNVDPYLNIRETDSMKADVIGRLKNEKRGYVIEQGTIWTKIATVDLKTIGYCYNEFLELEEIDKADYPKELLSEEP